MSLQAGSGLDVLMRRCCFMLFRALFYQSALTLIGRHAGLVERPYGKPIRWQPAVFGGLILCGLAACNTLPIPSPVSHSDEAAYTRLYPYYLEFCALSEIQKKPGYGADIRGGVGGHSTIYLNGVCLAGDGYPEIALCRSDPASNGVGLSVNAHFANANWIAIPGRDFFYHGDLNRGQALTRRVYDATKAHAKRLGIYDAIRFHDRVFEEMPAGYDRDAFKYEVSIGTDYAIGYARDRYCARVPVSAAEMTRIVAYLNALNRPYRDGKAEYQWSVLNDNCIHVAHNALSSIGFWPPWPTHRFILLAAFDFPVPKNEFVNIMRRANDMPVENLLAVWDDQPARRALLAGDELAARAGAIATFEPVTQDNALYNTDLQLIFYDDPMFGGYEGRYRRIATDPRYTDLELNLQYFRALYGQIATARQPLDWWLTAYPALRSESDFPTFYARFYERVERSAAAVSAARSVLAAIGD
jgi:hypothetical protein